MLDLGADIKLRLAEACAGLRYLVPLISLGAIAGLMMRAPLWMGWTVFLVTVPSTIFMNSFRIAVTGMLVTGGGAAHTEGFLHFFEGWVVFIVAAALLLAVIWLLTKLFPGRPNLIDVLSWQTDTAAPAAPAAGGAYRFPGKPMWSITVLIFVAIAASIGLAGRGEQVPERKSLNDFPVLIGNWTARVDRLPSLVEEVAGASEYFYGDFSTASGEMVNAYISYYENQRHGQIPHSPAVCIPGGGWVIETQDTATVQAQAGSPFVVNRLVTALGPRRVIA